MKMYIYNTFIITICYTVNVCHISSAESQKGIIRDLPSQPELFALAGPLKGAIPTSLTL